jgi:hypothetical protein
VRVHFPAKITDGRFLDSPGYLGEVRGHVMLESLLANLLQSFVQSRDVYHAGAAERLQRVLCEFALTDIPSNPAMEIVC